MTSTVITGLTLTSSTTQPNLPNVDIYLEKAMSTSGFVTGNIIVRINQNFNAANPNDVGDWSLPAGTIPLGFTPLDDCVLYTGVKSNVGQHFVINMEIDTTGGIRVTSNGLAVQYVINPYTFKDYSLTYLISP
jgi:hypothetical protein